MARAQTLAYSYRNDPAVPPFDDAEPLFVFDGHCALCSAAVQFILRHDKAPRFRFASAQSALGAALYRHYGLAGEDYESNLLLHEGVLRIKSDGSLRVFELLGLPWSLARACRVLPERWRDAIYEIIARNRLRWFGRREVCFAPGAADRERFLA